MKKFLSLVLALAMTMSLVTVSAGAKDFTDNSKIEYKEAVDVVSAAGIVDGYTDGAFNPQNTLTRGAAAKIICNLILGPTTASALRADTAPYSDVPTTNTFAGYIAYCQKEGIISGYADGTFKPGASLTGYAFMKMLLGALGYDSSIEGYTGPNWSIAVGKRAIGIELDDGNDNFVGVNAVTREEACLYAFNTMKATMVDYDSRVSVDVNGTTVNVGNNTAFEVSNTSSKTDGNIKDDGKMQFAEKYFDKLKGEDDTDDLGRPATTWKYDGETIGTYANDADYTMVLNKVKNADDVLYADSDYFDFDQNKDFASKISLYVNGDKQTNVSTVSDLNKVELKAGDQVEVYENDDNDITTIAVIRYSLAKINEVDKDLSSTYTKKGASYAVYLENLSGSSIGSAYYDKYDGDSGKELAGFDASTYEKDTVLAVALNGDEEVVASHVATANSGKVTAYDGGSKATVTLDSTDYALHSNVDMTNSAFVKDKNAYSLTSAFNYDDSVYTVYTDVNGYVIGIDETESVKIEDVYYVAGLIKDTSRYTTYYAQAVSLADGTVTEFKLDEKDSKNTTAFGASWTSSGYLDSFKQVQGLYTFDKDGSVYTAEKYTGDNTYYVYGIGSIADDLARDDTKMTVDGQKVYLNDKTNYIKVESEAADISVKTATGGTSVKETNGSNHTTAIAVATKDGSNRIASYVVLVSADFANASSDDVVFVASQSNKTVSYKNADGKSETGFATELYFLDGSGKVETVTTDDDYTAGFYTYEINDDEVYELTTGKLDLASSVDSSTHNYDDEAGYVGFTTAASDGDVKDTDGIVLTGIYNNALSMTDTTVKKLTDLDFSDKVIVADNRSKDDRDADYYTNEITSVSQLKSAIEKNDSNADVKAIVYVDNKEVVMVYVMSMANAGTSSGSNPDFKPSENPKGTFVNTGANEVNVNLVNASSTSLDSSIKSDVKSALADKGYNVLEWNSNKAVTDKGTFDVTITNYWTLTVDGSVIEYVEAGTNSTTTWKDIKDVKGGTGYLVSDSYNAYGSDGDSVVKSASKATDIEDTGYVQVNLTTSSADSAFTVDKPTYVKAGKDVVVTLKAKSEIDLQKSSTPVSVSTSEDATLAYSGAATNVESNESNTLTFKKDSGLKILQDETITITYKNVGKDLTDTITYNAGT